MHLEKVWHFLICHNHQSTYLASCCVGVDGDLTGSPSMTVDCRCHLLSVDQGFNFIPGWHKLSAFSLFKRFINEKGILFHFCAWKLVMHPVGTSTWLQFVYLKIVSIFNSFNHCLSKKQSTQNTRIPSWLAKQLQSNKETLLFVCNYS